MIAPQIVAALKGKAEWIALEAHIRENLSSLDSITDALTGLKKGDDRAIAVEAAARLLAAEKLRAILEPFEVFEEANDTSRLVKEKKEDAGL